MTVKKILEKGGFLADPNIYPCSQVVKRKEMLEEVATYMVESDKLSAKQKSEEEALGEADDEGWVTVSKSSKLQTTKAKKAAEREAAELLRGKKNRRQKKRKGGGELKNFYVHQIKDEKIQQIQSLRAKFEEDKLKIAKMKADRKFRPF